jgi:hypothetical protein
MRLASKVGWLLFALLSTGCPLPGSSAAPGSAARYELVCDSSDTRETSTLFCVRMDTSTGDAKRVDLGKVTKTSGSTMGPDKGAGSYQLVCDSTSTETQAEFHCLRLNRFSGEVVLISLPQVESFSG